MAEENNTEFKTQFGESRNWKWLRSHLEDQKQQAMKLLGIQSKTMDFNRYYALHKEEVDKKVGILKF